MDESDRFEQLTRELLDAHPRSSPSSITLLANVGDLTPEQGRRVDELRAAVGTAEGKDELVAALANLHAYLSALSSAG